MILGFSKLVGAKEKVLQGTKIHSIRGDKRWRKGMSIQFASGVRTKKYKQWHTGRATNVQTIEIDSQKRTVVLDSFIVNINGVEAIAKNDGFDNVDDFFDFFRKKKGLLYLIHWTDRYNESPYNDLPF